MTLPANIRINGLVQFPARAVGAGFIAIDKANGVFTVRPDYTLLGSAIPVPDPTTKVVVVYDTVTGLYNVTTLATLISVAINAYRMVTAAGDVTIASTDLTILLNKTVGAATNIILPTAASRQGVPVHVKDYKGDANTNNITFVMAGSETVDGLGQAAADTAGITKIRVNRDDKILYPLISGGWYTAK